VLNERESCRIAFVDATQAPPDTAIQLDLLARMHWMNAMAEIALINLVPASGSSTAC
jgi:hypothetical protein